jgi:hypothetical protein
MELFLSPTGPIIEAFARLLAQVALGDELLEHFRFGHFECGIASTGPRLRNKL